MCFGGERRLGVRLRRARGVMGRDQEKIASLPMRDHQALFVGGWSTLSSG